MREKILNAPRGIIYDRNKIPLVDNKPLYDIKLVPRDIDDSFNYSLLEKYTGISKEKIDSVFLFESLESSSYSFKPILIKRYIDFNLKSLLEEYKSEFNGMHFYELPARVYISDCFLTHVLGYLRQIDKDTYLRKIDENNSLYKYRLDDIIGFSGLEKFYENDLKGKNGVSFYFVDRLGINQGQDEDNHKLPAQGEDVYLTIDSKLQFFIENQLKDYKGSIIVSNPDNGEILAMASNPDYDLKSFIGPIPIHDWKKLKNNKNLPFMNRAIQQVYPPGSIFKLLLGSLALQKRIVDDNIKFRCEGEYKFYDTTFRCWKEDGHGDVNLSNAIKESCNIYFYNLMQKIEFDDWNEEILKFGFGQKVEIDLPGETIGNIPSRDYMNKSYKNKGGWSQGHLLNFSIGQGEVTVTPIQIIQAINLIAANGRTFRPHINLNIEKNKFDLSYRKDVWKFIKKSMYSAVNHNRGTAYRAKVDNKNKKVYGKTGTAQVCSNCDRLPHAWFTGFMEYGENNKISVCIMIENGGKGSDISAIIANKIFNYIGKDKDV